VTPKRGLFEGLKRVFLAVFGSFCGPFWDRGSRGTAQEVAPNMGIRNDGCAEVVGCLKRGHFRVCHRCVLGVVGLGCQVLGFEGPIL